MSHPVFSGPSVLGGNILTEKWSEFTSSVTNSSGDQQGQDFWDIVVGAGTDYLTAKQREDAAKAEAEAYRARIRAQEASASTYTSGGSAQGGEAWKLWLPIGLGVLALGGLAFYMFSQKRRGA